MRRNLVYRVYCVGILWYNINEFRYEIFGNSNEFAMGLFFIYWKVVEVVREKRIADVSLLFFYLFMSALSTQVEHS